MLIINKGDKMTVTIKQIDTGTFQLTEDGVFHCTHEDAYAIYEAGGDGITEPRGGWVIECPAYDCDGIEEWEFDDLLERTAYDGSDDYDED